VFPDVLILDRTDVGWFCEIEGRRVFVARLQVAPGTVVPVAGTRGPLAIAGYAVADVQAKLRRRVVR
jgi:hypothetical protein